MAPSARHLSGRGGRAGRPALLGLLLASLLLAAGCGGDSREADARASVERYFLALSERDFGGACAELTESFRRELVTYAERAFPTLSSSECEVIAERIAEANGELVGLQRRVKVREVDVDGDEAVARLGPGQSAELERVDGDWQISRLDFSGAAG